MVRSFRVEIRGNRERVGGTQLAHMLKVPSTVKELGEDNVDEGGRLKSAHGKRWGSPRISLGGVLPRRRRF